MKAIDTKQRRISPWIAWPAVLGIAVVLFSLAQVPNASLHIRVLDTLRRTRTADQELNQDAYALRFGIDRSCDSVVGKQLELVALHKMLFDEALTAYGGQSSEARSALGTIDAAIGSKYDAVERFKSAN